MVTERFLIMSQSFQELTQIPIEDLEHSTAAETAVDSLVLPPRPSSSTQHETLLAEHQITFESALDVGRRVWEQLQISENQEQGSQPRVQTRNEVPGIIQHALDHGHVRADEFHSTESGTRLSVLTTDNNVFSTPQEKVLLSHINTILERNRDVIEGLMSNAVPETDTIISSRLGVRDDGTFASHGRFDNQRIIYIDETIINPPDISFLDIDKSAIRELMLMNEVTESFSRLPNSIMLSNQYQIASAVTDTVALMLRNDTTLTYQDISPSVNHIQRQYFYAYSNRENSSSHQYSSSEALQAVQDLNHRISTYFPNQPLPFQWEVVEKNGNWKFSLSE